MFLEYNLDVSCGLGYNMDSCWYLSILELDVCSEREIEVCEGEVMEFVVV